MKAMKVRLLAMGVILSIIGTALLAVRGYNEDFLGLLGLGATLFLLGLLWR